MYSRKLAVIPELLIVEEESTLPSPANYLSWFWGTENSLWTIAWQSYSYKVVRFKVLCSRSSFGVSVPFNIYLFLNSFPKQLYLFLGILQELKIKLCKIQSGLEFSAVEKLCWWLASWCMRRSPVDSWVLIYNFLQRPLLKGGKLTEVLYCYILKRSTVPLACGW